jgi:hypothetical protein
MAKAVLTTKTDPAYDDLPEERYHFPRTNLRRVEAALGDWIVYCEPRRHFAIGSRQLSLSIGHRPARPNQRRASPVSPAYGSDKRSAICALPYHSPYGTQMFFTCVARRK